mmetsp:Transcript_35160/g.100147  ORF Transcript_35160/g.100147 Transcript_35160/m.100147 type:complete len:484 (+) Transcript_35160:220-1671(+)
MRSRARQHALLLPVPQARQHLRHFLLAEVLHHDQILARDDAGEQALGVVQEQVPETELPEEHVATVDRCVLRHRVEVLRHVGAQVEGLPDGVAAQGLEARALLRELPHHRVPTRDLRLLVEHAASLSAVQKEVQCVPRHVAHGSPVAENREAVMATTLELGMHALRGLDLRESYDIPRHDVSGGNLEELVLRIVLQERHPLELDDVQVVDAATEEVPCPSREHGGCEDGQRELRVARDLHEDHGQGDRDPRGAREHCGGSDQSVDARVGLDKGLDGLPDEAAHGCPAQQGRHEQAAGHAETVGDAGRGHVDQEVDQQQPAVEVLVRRLVQQRSERACAGHPEESLRRGQLLHRHRLPVAGGRHPEEHGGERKGDDQDLGEAEEVVLPHDDLALLAKLWRPQPLPALLREFLVGVAEQAPDKTAENAHADEERKLPHRVLHPVEALQEHRDDGAHVTGLQADKDVRAALQGQAREEAADERSRR